LRAGGVQRQNSTALQAARANTALLIFLKNNYYDSGKPSRNKYFQSRKFEGFQY
jgi:hypothetical protein